MPAILQLLIALQAAALLTCTVNAELVLVYSLQRHGARNVLPKDALLGESDASGGPTLLPAGQSMCYEAGTAFHQRYISTSSCSTSTPDTCLSQPGREDYGVISTPGVGYNNYNSYAASSGLDRTIMSANSFLAGVFPKDMPGPNSTVNLEVPPVYSVSDSEDWRVRGYAKCPAYQRRLQGWLQSDAFRQKEQESQALRQRVQQVAPQLNTSLATWWDVYDSFNVWRTYGVGNPMPPLDNATFSQVNSLAMWLETSKMDPELTGNLLGGGLLGDMLARMQAAEQAVAAASQAPYYKLLTVSSHYNTQLGVLSALQAGMQPAQRPQHIWQSKIPSLAAVLAFELHRTPQGTFVVRAVFQDGPQARYKTMPLPCAVKGDAAELFAGPGSCTLGAFRALAGPQAFNSSADWCEACSNNKVTACMLRNMQRQLAAAGVDPAAAAAGDKVATSSSSRGSSKAALSPGVVAILCVASAAAVLLLVGCIVPLAVWLRRKRRMQQPLADLNALHSLPSAAAPLSRFAPV